MWCPNKKIFDELEPGAAFMACRWHELFDGFTPDTFHPKLYSLSSLAAEATMIGELHEDHDAWIKHLTRVQFELTKRLERGVELTVCSPRHLGMLDRMSKSQSPSEVAGIGSVLALEGLSSGIEAGIREKVVQLTFADAKNRKSETDEILTSLATFAFRKGCSTEDASEPLEILKADRNAVKDWILAGLPENTKEFDCVIGVQTLDENAVRGVCAPSKAVRTSPNIPGLPKIKDVTFFRRKGSGNHPIDAINALKADVRASLSLLALYNQRANDEILDDAWIVEGDGAKLISKKSPSFLNLHPRNNAVPLAGKAATALAGSRSEPAIRAALDLHNLALSMMDHRLRLVNLWSALECLASLIEGDSIISRVERLVCPILAWRKPDRIVRYIAISIHRWLTENPEIKQTSLPFHLGPSKFVAVEQILTLLTDAKNGKGITSLLNVVSGHPLLLHRVNEAWNLFNDPRQLQRNIAQSQERLGWHLWRIYRARNLLVHRGVEPDCLPQLANHLQQYLSSTLSRLLHGLTFGERWTARDSWHFWKEKSSYLLSALSTKPQILMLQDFFPGELQQPSGLVYPAPSGDALPAALC